MRFLIVFLLLTSVVQAGSIGLNVEKYSEFKLNHYSTGQRYILSYYCKQIYSGKQEVLGIVRDKFGYIVEIRRYHDETDENGMWTGMRRIPVPFAKDFNVISNFCKENNIDLNKQASYYYTTKNGELFCQRINLSDLLFKKKLDSDFLINNSESQYESCDIIDIPIYTKIIDPTTGKATYKYIHAK